MANTNSEFITAWNEIFSFKVAEIDLTRPTEQFVFNALVSYLKQFSIDITPMIEERNGDLNFKIQFCKYIDHFYKISDKSNSFLYYDLIHPSPKKTAHMLKYLLNYWLYYNMMKKDIVHVANQKVQEHAELLEMEKNTLMKNEKLQIKKKMIEKSVKEYKQALPTLNAKIESLQGLENSLTEKIRELQEICRNSDSMLAQLKTTEEDLKRGVVSQDEVESLRANEASLQKAISEQEEIENATLQSNQTRSDTINKLAPLIKQIESTPNVYPCETLLSAKEAKAKLTELTRKYSQQKATNEKKSADIEIYSKKLEELEQIIRTKMSELQETVIALEDKVQAYNLNIESEKKLSEILSENQNNLEEEDASAVDICNYILELAENFVQQVRFT